MATSKPEAVKPGANPPPALKAGAERKYPVSMSDEEWRKKLTPEQYHVLRSQGTEPRYCKGYAEIEKHGKGSYVCVACGNTLFTSQSKFHSGTGWPSFYSPIDEKAVENRLDADGTGRMETVCNQCGSHLGHVFPDGPPPTGMRYCMNAVCLKFVEAKEEK
jgi:peptide-methionine (R)-S-oxide reductase